MNIGKQTSDRWIHIDIMLIKTNDESMNDG